MHAANRDSDPGRGTFLVLLLALALPPTLLCIDRGLAALRNWHAQFPVDRFFMRAIIVWFCAVALVGALPPARRWFRRVGLRLVVLELSACVAWLAIDGALQLQHGRPGFHTHPSGLRAVFTPDPSILPGTSTPSYFTLNSEGIRGPEFPAPGQAFRILCIGGSTTECAYLDDSRAWPSLLMQHLNESTAARPVWVGNIGTSGYTMREHTRFIDESNLMREIDCLIVTAGFNDLHWTLVGGEKPRAPVGPLWSRSLLLGKVRAVWSRAHPITLEDATGASYRTRRERRSKMQVIRELPDLASALDRFERRIVEATEGARRAGVTLVFVTQPVLWSPNLSPRAESMLWMGWIDDEHRLPPDLLSEAMTRFNDRLRTTCAKLDVPCLSMDELNGRDEMFLDDCHFTETGAGAVADRIAAWFLHHRERVGW